MSKQLITLTPLEPWFFGTDRTFKHPDRERQRDGGYFIRSADTPSQTTLFGVLRYLGIENPTANFSLTDENKARIGNESFLLGKNNQDFGKIKSISPLYLLDDVDQFYVPVPLDHKVSKDHKWGEVQDYLPFKDYQFIETSQGQRVLPADYEEKGSLANGWMCLSDKKIYDDLFQGVTNIGIDKQKPEEAFFKRERKIFTPSDTKKPEKVTPNRFAFFADVDFDIPDERIVHLGQQKSAFWAKTEQIEPPETEPHAVELKNGEKCETRKMSCLNENIAYVQSDLFIEKPETLYAACKLVIVRLTTTRPFETIYGTGVANRYSTRYNLLRLIQAGSIFWMNDVETFKKAIKNEHAAIAGFNQIIIGGKENENSSL